MAAVFRKSKVDWSKYSGKVEGAYDSYIAYSLLRDHGNGYLRSREAYRVQSPRRRRERRVSFGTTEGLAYVHGLILVDPAFGSIAKEIRRTYLGLEKHLAKLSLLSSMFHLR